MKKIKLSAGKYAIVDDEDYDFLNRWKWSASCQHGIWYAQKKCRGKNTRMHRLIMDAKPNEILDHINDDGLDNRKANLRFVTASQNSINSRARANTSSKYKGVSFRKSTGKWESYINLHGKRKHLGFFINEIDAAKQYDKIALLYQGKYARLNFPNDTLSQ